MRRTPQQYHGNRITNRAVGGDGNRPGALRALPVRLSQCMIVKNEENNIERALTWAKGIAFEQIVVDTGSTDRTVEIAERLGAKVFHFKWIDDFAAAKNFAIEKARGNWIAFLDADEYFTEDGARELKTLLDDIQRKPDMRDTAVIECDWLQLDDYGEVFLNLRQRRVFRNDGIKYIGRIHEYLGIPPSRRVHYVEAIRILHTGYAPSVIKETNKSERNITILREELARRPDSVMLKAYLADSLAIDKNDYEKQKEAASLYNEVVNSTEKIADMLLKSAYDYLINAADRQGDKEEFVSLCDRGSEALPDTPDFAYRLGGALFNEGKYRESLERFMQCDAIIAERAIENYRMSADNLATMYHRMSLASFKLDDYENGIKYAERTLRADKYKGNILTILIGMLTCYQNDRERIDHLRQFYDFDDPRDKLFLAKCAKEANDTVLAMVFYKSITNEDRAALNAESA